MTSRVGVGLWVKAAISVAVLTVVLLRVDLSAVADAFARVDWALFLLTLGLLLPLGFTGIQRWRSVAATFGEDLPISKAFIYTVDRTVHQFGLSLDCRFGFRARMEDA